MDVVSECELPVAYLVWQPSPREHALTVVCKSTYRFHATGVSLLAEQDAPLVTDVFWNADPRCSLRAATDVVPLKERVDVVVVGHAYAPRGVPVAYLVARLAVGEIDKTIEIDGDRHQLSVDATLHEGAEFDSMPLLYERAVGGPWTSNPVGPPSDVEVGGALPNLRLATSAAAASRGVASTSSFGPISPTWPLRSQLLRYPWSSQDIERPLPSDFDLAFFNHAPPDQQLATLRGGDVVTLEHLHREHAHVRFELPTAEPWLSVVRAASDAAPEEVLRMRLDTLSIDTDRATCSLTWRATIQLDGPHDAVRVVVLFDPGDEAAGAPDTPAPHDFRDADRIRDLPFRSVRDEASDRSGRWAASSVASSAAAPSAPTTPAAHPSSSGGAGAPVASGGATLEFEIPDAMPHPPLAAAPPPAATERAAAAGVVQHSRVVAQAPAEHAMAPALPVPPPPPWQRPPSPMAPAVESRWGSDVRPPPWVAAPSPASPSTPSAEPSPSPWMGPSRSGAPASLTVGQVAAVASTPSAPSAPPVPVVARSPLPVEAAAAPVRGARLEKGEVLQLLWYDPAVVPRARRVPAHRDVLDELERRSRSSDLDDVTGGPDPMAVEDRRDVFEILARCAAIADDDWADDLLDAAIDRDKFVPGLVLVGGELSVIFEETAMLRALMTVATPLALGDEPLKAALQDAREFLSLPDMLSPASVTEAMSARLVEAFRKANRSLAPKYLESHAERALLERRSYQRREVFGEPHLRAALSVGGSRSVPTYLPAVLTSRLPMFARFRVRALAELHLPEDHLDTHIASLRVLALGRVATLAGRAADTKGR